MTTKLILFAFLILLSINQLTAQISKMKWGKLSKDEIALKSCSFDAEADAVVLFDEGDVKFDYSGYIYTHRYTRIKVLKETGINSSNIVLRFFSKDNSESITNVTAQTINFDLNGKPVVQAVQNTDIMTVKVSDYYTDIRFAFPSVTVGSILEFKYTKLSKNISFLDAWFFQSEYPTYFSKCSFYYPDGVSYNVLYLGERLIRKYGNNLENSWELSNLPAIKELAYSGNTSDYTEKIRLQLSGYTKKSDTYAMDHTTQFVSFMTSWDNFSNELLKMDKYQQFLENSFRYKKIINNIIENTDSD